MSFETDSKAEVMDEILAQKARDTIAIEAAAKKAHKMVAESGLTVEEWERQFWRIPTERTRL